MSSGCRCGRRSDTGRSERTVRQHAIAAYQQSGLGGRAELSAFCLEDLMLPDAAWDVERTGDDGPRDHGQRMFSTSSRLTSPKESVGSTALSALATTSRSYTRPQSRASSSRTSVRPRKSPKMRDAVSPRCLAAAGLHEGRNAETPRWPLASLAAPVGDGTERVSGEGRCSGRRMASGTYDAHVVSAGGRRDCAESGARTNAASDGSEVDPSRPWAARDGGRKARQLATQLTISLGATKKPTA